MGKKTSDDANMRLAKTIILNRILQTDKSPLRKTLTQIAKKHECDVKKVVRNEQYIMQKLREKVNVLKILINVD